MMAGRIASQRLWSLAVMFAVSTGQVMLMSHASYGPAGDLISSQCRNKSEGKLERNDFATVFRLESPECVLYEQIVVFAIARSRRERDRARDSEISFCRNRLASTARQYEMLPLLSERRVELRVPPTGPAEVSYAGLPFDTIEDLLPSSPAYRQVAQILDPQPILLSTRPVTPLHKGQIGLLSTAGLINGRFGSGDRLHVAAWKTKKRVIRTEESEDEKTIIREREQFVHELALAFANGETALIE